MREDYCWIGYTYADRCWHLVLCRQDSAAETARILLSDYQCLHKVKELTRIDRNQYISKLGPTIRQTELSNNCLYSGSPRYSFVFDSAKQTWFVTSRFSRYALKDLEQTLAMGLLD